MKILVIDPDKVMGSRLKDFLVQQSYEVELVSKAESALEIFQDTAFHAVFIDEKLPDKEGISLLSELKVLRGSTSFVMMFSELTLTHVVMSRASGAFDLVQKPFKNFSEVQNVINKIQDNISRWDLLVEKAKAIKEKNKAQ